MAVRYGECEGKCLTIDPHIGGRKMGSGRMGIIECDGGATGLSPEIGEGGLLRIAGPAAIQGYVGCRPIGGLGNRPLFSRLA